MKHTETNTLNFDWVSENLKDLALLLKIFIIGGPMRYSFSTLCKNFSVNWGSDTIGLLEPGRSCSTPQLLIPRPDLEIGLAQLQASSDHAT